MSLALPTLFQDLPAPVKACQDIESVLCTQRDRAWSIWPYPCIGSFRFLDLSISLSPLYPAILDRLVRQRHTLLDLGCCFAQDVRKLVADGAPSENIYGAELRREFVDLGYELFRDRETLKSTFLVGSIFDSTPHGIFKDVEGEIDVVYAASIFHLFNWEDQLRLAERVATLLKPVPGALVLGRQRGNVDAAEYEHRTNENGTMFRHNEESFKKMWEEVGAKTGTAWEVRAWLEKDDDSGRWKGQVEDGLSMELDKGDRRLRFEVARK